MIVDVNAYLGHFAFRRLRHNTATSRRWCMMWTVRPRISIRRPGLSHESRSLNSESAVARAR